MSQENDRQLPDGWQWVKLGDVCEIIGGGTPSKARHDYYNGDILWATVRDMTGNIITETEHKITKEGLNNSSANIISKNNVVIATRVSLGKVCLLKNDTAINQDLKGIVPILSNQLSVQYLYYWLKSISNIIVNNGEGSTVKGINVRFVKNLKIPLPPLSEQKRIAAILNEQMEAVEKARKATEAQLEAAKALPAAYLRAVFESEEANSWERRKLGDVCRVTKLAGFEYTKYVNYNPDGKYIALRAQNVRNTGLDLSNFVKITEDVASYLSRSKLDSGDIVMTFIGANIGEATWIDKNDMFYCAPNIARITPNAELIDCQFLTRLIHSSEFQRQIRDINESTAQQSLSMKNIRDFWVVFPTLSQQKQIASTLTEQMQEVERLKQNLKEQLDTINKLPAVLLRRAFKGEL